MATQYMKDKPTAEDFAYAYAETADGALVRVPKNKVTGEGVTVDSELSETSTNPVQNKAVAEKINELSEELTDLKENGTGGGLGVTTAQANSLWTIMQKIAFSETLTDEELTGFKTAWVIESSGGSGETAWENGVAYDIQNTLVANEYVTTSGVIETYGNWSRTDYMPCKGVSYITNDNAIGLGDYNAFYDETKQFISSFVLNGGGTGQVIVPENACWFICSGSNVNMTSLFITPHAE